MLATLAGAAAWAWRAVLELCAWLLLLAAYNAARKDSAAWPARRSAALATRSLARLAALSLPAQLLRLGPGAGLRSCRDSTPPWPPCGAPSWALRAARGVVRAVASTPNALRALLGPLATAPGAATTLQRALPARALALPCNAAAAFARRPLAEAVWLGVVACASAAALTSALALAWRARTLRAVLQPLLRKAAPPALAVMMLFATALEASNAFGDARRTRLWSVAALRCSVAAAMALPAAALLGRRFRLGIGGVVAKCQRCRQLAAAALFLAGSAAQTALLEAPDAPRVRLRAAVLAAASAEVLRLAVARFTTRAVPSPAALLLKQCMALLSASLRTAQPVFAALDRVLSAAVAPWLRLLKLASDACFRLAELAWAAFARVFAALSAVQRCVTAAAAWVTRGLLLALRMLRGACGAAARRTWRAMQPVVAALAAVKRRAEALLCLIASAAIQVGWPLGCASSAAAFASAAVGAARLDQRATFAAAAAAQALTAAMMLCASLRRAGRARLSSRLEAHAARAYRLLDAWLTPPLWLALRLLWRTLQLLWRALRRGADLLTELAAQLYRAALRPALLALRRPLLAVWRSPLASLFASLAVLALAATAAAHRAPLLAAFEAARGACAAGWHVARGAAAHGAAATALAARAALPAGLGALRTSLAAFDAVLTRGAHSSPAFADLLMTLHVLQAAALRIALPRPGPREHAALPAVRTALTSFLACGMVRALLLPLALCHASATLRSGPGAAVATAVRGVAPFATLWFLAALFIEGVHRTTLLDVLHEQAQQPVRAAAAASGPAVRKAADDECVICFDELRSGPPARALRCGHAFHAPCVQAWLQAAVQKRCPICRAVAVASEQGGAPTFLWRDVLFD